MNGHDGFHAYSSEEHNLAVVFNTLIGCCEKRPPLAAVTIDTIFYFCILTSMPWSQKRRSQHVLASSPIALPVLQAFHLFQ
jgi:hypothetical protein